MNLRKKRTLIIPREDADSLQHTVLRYIRDYGVFDPERVPTSVQEVKEPFRALWVARMEFIRVWDLKFFGKLEKAIQDLNDSNCSNPLYWANKIRKEIDAHPSYKVRFEKA